MLNLRHRAKKLPSIWLATLALVALLAAAGCSDDSSNDDASTDGAQDVGTGDGAADGAADGPGDGPADAGSDALVPCDLPGGAKGIECGSSCVDPNSDPNHCSACNQEVGAGHVCYGGVERDNCPQVPQTSGIELGLCGGKCVNLNTDTANCGKCGEACPATQICFNGGCHCKVDPSEIPDEGADRYQPNDSTGRFRDCSGAEEPPKCVDTWTDPAHCGACAGDGGNVCGTGEFSTRPLCAKADGQNPLCTSNCGDLDLTQCDTTSSCVSLGELFNCGACGDTCEGNRLCTTEGETSECSCSAETIECGGQCVDTAIDVANCGGCQAEAKGEVCSGSTLCQGRDEGGTTVFECVCPINRGDCGDGCVNLQADNANCNECGSACASNLRCLAGECRCPEGFRNCGDPDQCTDPHSDPFNCGSCGNACSGDDICVNGQCVTSGCSGTGRKQCVRTVDSVPRTGCVDTRTDISNCGDCNVTCRQDQICAASLCACETGKTTCDGACVDLNIDPDHCGDCETACGPGQVCTKGTGEEKATCKANCPEGTTLCSGRCVDPNTDNENCGQCGSVCLASGAGAELCVGGVCTPRENIDEINCKGANQGWCFGRCVNLQAAGTPDEPNLNCGVCANPCSRVEICKDQEGYDCAPRGG